ncbi:hypothetical protein POTOM_003420 [Populus tomentosa]|uniref:Uncharacterized protein n=1 Tax=Populus tomentosa TaxID=118781 RepID=A0A8X8DLQ7_POPTO|nr:hypothetical protein POTOM_003420 [Populus tomentosa]
MVVSCYMISRLVLRICFRLVGNNSNCSIDTNWLHIAEEVRRIVDSTNNLLLNGFFEQILFKDGFVLNIPLISNCFLLRNPFISYMPNLVAFV